uniref:Protein kinase domain-containing protein n=1 Tax=Strongyloides venezuelensis TaxID=75913 RepID=A0A0K0FSH0_STRVS
MKLFCFFLFIVFVYYSYEIPSQRTRCAVECYSSCVFAGIRQALSCNCTLQVLSTSNCTSVDEDMLTTELEPSNSISVWSQYISAHAIQLKIQSFPSAFIYIFEYTQTNTSIKDEEKEWMYGGSSSTPSISFSVSDICSEYQFRVIIILKTTDPTRFMKVLSPIVIPQQLPNIDISPDKISIQMPEIIDDGRNIKVSFSWALPNGYMSYDIFGYESPQAYSINCFSNPNAVLNEEEYDKPSVEVLKSGGGMMIWTLPIDYLKQECRIWMEVKMVPRCSRVETTDISTPIDLDCDAFPKLPLCGRSNMATQCIDVIDIWGEDKTTNIHWQKPPNLGSDQKFFHVIFGKAKQIGAFPYTMWKIEDHQETVVNTSTTHLQIETEPNTPYAVQVCTIKDSSTMQTGAEKNGYVIPFVCSYCQLKDRVTDNKYCLECQKIEQRMPTFNAICPRDNYCKVPVKLGHGNKKDKQNGIKTVIGDTRKINEDKNVNKASFNITRNGFGTITDLSYFTTNSDNGERQFDSKTMADIFPIPISGNEGNNIKGTVQTVEVKAIVNDKEDDDVASSTIETNHPTTIVTPLKTVHSHSQDVLTKKIHILNTEQRITTQSTTTTTTSIPTTATTMTTTKKTTPQTTTKMTLNTISQFQLNNNNLFQGPCRMRSGIICEYGCRSEASCSCPPYLNTSCIRGLSCPPIPDTIAYYNQTTSTINIINKPFFTNITSNQNFVKSFTHLYLEISESLHGLDVKRIYKNIDLKDGEQIRDLNSTGVTFQMNNHIFYKQGNLNIYSVNLCLYNNSVIKGGPSTYYTKLTPLPFATIKDYMDRYQFNSIKVLPEETYKIMKNKSPTETHRNKTSLFKYLIPFIIFVITIFIISLLIYYCFVKRYKRLGNVAFYNTVHNPLNSTLQLSAYRPTIEHIPNDYFINTLDVSNVLPRVKLPSSFNEGIYHENNIHRLSTNYINTAYDRDSQEISLSEETIVKVNERRI